MQEELISKKELLKLTGISYGQLYRWKRQNLIPESWFIKQSTFTGQETFFPKEKVLERIREITELKDRFSLEKLADLFSPQSTNKLYSAGDIAIFPEFDPDVIQRFQQAWSRQSFTFKELLFIYALSKLKAHTVLEEADLTDMLRSIRQWLPQISDLSYRFLICKRQAQVFSLLAGQEAILLFDHDVSVLHSFELDDLAKDLNLKLNKVLEVGR